MKLNSTFLQSRSRPSTQRGFSLLEMVIVMGIIALILGGAMGLMGGIGDAAKMQRVDGDFSAYGAGLDTYKINAGNYPTTAQGLKALIEKPSSSPIPKRWVQISTKLNQDPWGNDYRYRRNGKKDSSRYEIISNGPDGNPDSDDDISSQE